MNAINWRAWSITDLMYFRSLFVVFAQIRSPAFLHVALNSFMKHCSDVLSAALCFVCTYDYGKDFRFHHKKAHSSRKNIGGMFPEGIQKLLWSWAKTTKSDLNVFQSRLRSNWTLQLTFLILGLKRLTVEFLASTYSIWFAYSPELPQPAKLTEQAFKCNHNHCS